MTGINRRDRMIAAFKELNGDERTLPGHSYGKCDACGARIEWVKTARGRWQPCAPNTAEPHLPHCGKQHWTTAKWDEHLEDIKRREERHNAHRAITKPKGAGKREHQAEKAATPEEPRRANAKATEPAIGEARREEPSRQAIVRFSAQGGRGNLINHEPGGFAHV